MSYPSDNPAENMADIWTSGSYTPHNVVRYIRDDYTPINKNSMRNSLGEEVSLIQNFVNEKYLARSTTPIGTGYIHHIETNDIYLNFSYPYGGTISEDLLYYQSGDANASYASDYSLIDNGASSDYSYIKTESDKIYLYYQDFVGAGPATYQDECTIVATGITYEDQYGGTAGIRYAHGGGLLLDGDTVRKVGGNLSPSGNATLGTAGNPWPVAYITKINTTGGGLSYESINTSDESITVSSGTASINFEYDPLSSTPRHFSSDVFNAFGLGKVYSVVGTLNGDEGGLSPVESASISGYYFLGDATPYGTLTVYLDWTNITVGGPFKVNLVIGYEG